MVGVSFIWLRILLLVVCTPLRLVHTPLLIIHIQLLMNSVGKSHVGGHEGYTFGMNGTQSRMDIVMHYLLLGSC
jgi:hypothetical protein